MLIRGQTKVKALQCYNSSSVWTKILFCDVCPQPSLNITFPYAINVLSCSWWQGPVSADMQTQCTTETWECCLRHLFVQNKLSNHISTKVQLSYPMGYLTCPLHNQFMNWISNSIWSVLMIYPTGYEMDKLDFQLDMKTALLGFRRFLVSSISV